MFRIRDDVDRLSREALIDYVGTLEARLVADADTDARQGVLHLQRLFGLTPKEAELLAAFVDGRPRTKDSLMAVVYGGALDMPEAKIIDVFVCKIRRKIAGSGISIETLWGSGYHVPDTDALKRAMAGDAVDFDGEAQPARIGRPVGGQTREKGSVRDLALAYLLSNAELDGEVRTTGKALSAIADAAIAGSMMIRNLERSGYLTVLAAPSRGNVGGEWRLRLTEKGVGV